MPYIQIPLETSRAGYIFNGISDCEVPYTSTRYLLSLMKNYFCTVVLELEGSDSSCLLSMTFSVIKKSGQIKYLFLRGGGGEQAQVQTCSFFLLH